MSTAPPRWRGLGLVALAVAGVVLGYFAVTRSRGVPEVAPPQDATASTTAAAPGTVAAPTTTAAPLPPTSLLDPGAQRTGSNVSVVGGLDADAMRRLGVTLSPGIAVTAPAVSLVADTDPPPAARRPGTGFSGTDSVDGPPAAASFTPAVQEAASRYVCLCGCPDNLALCACNEQPVGAVTMLSYLERLLDAGPAPETVDAAMIDRYGERVLASP